ncbi:hypothetical protein JCM8097_001175 [Rhodosporidiobolus ruineniae]
MARGNQRDSSSSACSPLFPSDQAVLLHEATLVSPLTSSSTRAEAREKAQKKAADANKGRKDDGRSHQKRAEDDATIMRQKQEAAAAKKAAEGAKPK